jgi:Domain of unknown function (DUF3806)
MFFLKKIFGQRESSKFKTLDLPDASVRIPSAYHSEKQEDGTTVLLPPMSDVCIRISSIFVSGKVGQPAPQMADYVRNASQERSTNVEESMDGRVTFSYEEESVENNTPIIIRYWHTGLDDCLTIFSAAFPVALRNSARTSEVLEETKQIMESYARNTRKEFLETANRTVETTVSRVPDPPVQTRRIFNDEERRQLAANLAAAGVLAARYGSNAEALTPTILDAIFKRWLQDVTPDAPPGDDVALAIGAAFGEFLITHLDMQWEILTDEYGTAWAVKHRQSSITGFPIETVRKRIADRKIDFLQGVFIAIRHQIESGEYQ